MKVIFLTVPQELIENDEYKEYIKERGDLSDIKVVQAYTLDKKYYVVTGEIDVDSFTSPILEIRNSYVMKSNTIIKESKIEKLKMKVMKSCNIIKPFSNEKMKIMLDHYLKRQNLNNEYQLIELAYAYPGLLLPEQHSVIGKEFLPNLYLSFEPIKLEYYKDKKIINDNQITIQFHSLMMELPIDILKTFYGLPTKLSQIYRSLFPNTWPQALFNFTTDIIIHPTYNGKMIVVVNFAPYHGYVDHPNTITLLDNLNTLTLLKKNYTTLSLDNTLTSSLDKTIPFPIIDGLPDCFQIIDYKMDIKISCYRPDLSFINEIQLDFPTNWKIPGDTSFGFITNKNGVDPHQYHYILRRLVRYLFDSPYVPYKCIMSEDDLPDTIMSFEVIQDNIPITYELPYCSLFPMYE